MTLSRLTFSRARGSDGFLVVEAIVAIGIGAIVVTFAMAGLASSLKAVRETKRLQQATALGTEAVEGAKKASYDGLVMVASDIAPANDARIKTTCTGLTGTRFIDPDGTDPDLACEKIVSSPTGGSEAINPHKTTETVDALEFTVWRYVTQVRNQDGLKRIVAIVEWDGGAAKRSFHISGTVSAVRRGLPSPEFELLPASQSVKVMRGYQVVLGHTIRNLGVDDTYELRMTEGAEAPTRTWTYSFYNDTNGDGLLDPGEPELTDTTGTATGPDTGQVVTDDQISVLAVWDIAPDDEVGLETMKFRATSNVDSEFWKETTDKTEVTAAATDLLLHLHDEPTPPVGPTNAQAHLPMTPNAAAAGELFAYSQDLNALQPGRVVRPGSTALPGHTESDPHLMANWVFQVPKTTPYDGTARVTLFVPSPENSCEPLPMDFTVYLHKKAAATDPGNPSPSALLGSQPFTGDAEPISDGGICPSQRVTVDVPVPAGPNSSVNSNQWIDLKITAGPEETVIGYDANGFDSTVTLPRAVAAV